MNLIRYWFVVLAISSAEPVLAADNTVRVGGGTNTGEYIHVARAICDVLGKLFDCRALETGGTMDNLQRLEHRDLEFGLAMSNMADQWLQDHNIVANYTVIRRIGGESMLVFGKPETIAAVGSWIGVRENASLMSVGLAGELSGDSSVLNTLRSVPGSPLINLKVKIYPSRLALLEGVSNGEVKLGFVVQIPNPENALFKAIANANLTIMGVIDPDMVALNEVYPVKSVTVQNASWFGFVHRAQQIETANVPVAVIAIKPEVLTGRAAMVQKAAISQIQEVSGASLLPQSSWVQDFINASTLTIGSGLDQILDAMKTAAEGARERILRL